MLGEAFSAAERRNEIVLDERTIASPSIPIYSLQLANRAFAFSRSPMTCYVLAVVGLEQVKRETNHGAIYSYIIISPPL